MLWTTGGRRSARGAELETEWRERLAAYAAEYPEVAARARAVAFGNAPDGMGRALPELRPEGPLATRQASGLALQAIAASVPNLVGGSADLGGSTGTTLKQGGTLRADDHRPGAFTGACGSTAWRACLNGIAAHGGLRPFGSTFLVFSDYMKPAIRLAAIMRLPVIYIGTHDSIGVGEDGPTHQPIEHLAMLRAIPNLVVLRPADATETVEAWRVAMARRDRPDDAGAHPAEAPGARPRGARRRPTARARGAYIVLDPTGGEPEAILIATGSEVARGARRGPAAAGRTASAPGWCRCRRGSCSRRSRESYRDEVLPPAVRVRVRLEAACPDRMVRWITNDGAMIGMEGFGASAPGERLFEEFKLTPERVADTVRRLLLQTHSTRSEGTTRPRRKIRCSASPNWGRASGTITSPGICSRRASWSG